MTALPARTGAGGITDAATNVGQQKANLGDLRDYLAGLFGTAGTPQAALSTVGALANRIVEKTGTFDLLAADRGTIFDATGTWSLTEAVATSTFGGDFAFFVRNAGSGVITFDPNGAEQVEGGPSYAVNPGDFVGFIWDVERTTWRVFSKSNSNTATPVERRQTALTGALDSNGQAAFLAAGSGLALNLSATATALVLAFAGGFGPNGAIDKVTRLNADVTGAVTALPANTTSFIYADYVSGSQVAWNKTILAPQVGDAYDRTKQGLLHFNGVDGATSFLDDYGNTWVAAGQAQLDTAQFKFGASSLLLDGTGDNVTSTNFTALSDGSGAFTLEGWFRFNAFGANSTNQVLINATNATDWGAAVALNTSGGGTRTLAIRLSSNGSSGDIADITAGSRTTWATGTWYHIALVYDALAGNYYTYVDGVLDQTRSSSSRICGLSKIRLGGTAAPFTSGVEFNGWIDEFRASPCCRYPAGTTFTPSASAFTVDGHFYSIPEMKMYEITGASPGAGQNPAMTARDRVFLGEADTSGAAVTAVRNYAYRGRYVSPEFGLALSSAYANNHQIGVLPGVVATSLVCKTAEAGWSPGEQIPGTGVHTSNNSSNGYSTSLGRNSVAVATGLTGISVVPKAGGAVTTITVANWRLKTTCDRGW